MGEHQRWQDEVHAQTGNWPSLVVVLKSPPNFHPDVMPTGCYASVTLPGGEFVTSGPCPSADAARAKLLRLLREAKEAG